MDISPIGVVKRVTPEVSGSSLSFVVMVAHLSSFPVSLDSLPRDSVSLYRDLLTYITDIHGILCPFSPSIAMLW